MAWGSGRVPVGINTSDSNFNAVEKTGGVSAVTLTASQMPSHTHTFTGSSTTTNSAGGHTHNIGRDTDGGAGSSRYTVHSAGTSGAQATSPTSSAGAHTHTMTPKERTQIQEVAAPTPTCSPISSAICGSGQHNFIFSGNQRLLFGVTAFFIPKFQRRNAP